MMRTAISFLLLLFSAQSLLALDVPVRSGEHDGFTRLVLDAPPGTTWQLQRAGATASIILPRSDTRFDVSSVFSRIGRERISTVAADGRRLQVNLGCECDIEIFRSGARMIVVDVLDEERGIDTGKATPRLSFGFPAERMSGVARRLSFATDLTDAETVGLVEETAPEIPTGRETGDLVTASLESSVLPSAIGGVVVTDTFPTIPLTPNLDTSGQAMIEQIGRAASQGLLTPVQTRPQVILGGDSGQDPGKTEKAVDANLASILTGRANLRATTSVDASRVKPDEVHDIVGATNCVPDEMLDVRSWADPELDLVQQIGMLRSGLYGEFDGVDAKTALELAKLYVHYGFGAEARATLAVVDKNSPEKSMVAILARIVDGHVFGQDNPLQGQESCTGRVAFWALIGSQDPEISLPQSDTDVLKALNELPEDLRIHLGPVFAERMLAVGNSELSRNALRMAARAVDQPTEQMEIADAQLLLSAGETKPAKEKLREVALADGELSAEALVRLVHTEMNELGALSSDIPSHIDALIRENEDTEIAPRLRHALALSHALASDFASAADAYADARGHLADADRKTLDAGYFRLLADRANARDFLLAAVQVKPQTIDNLDLATGNQVAARLLDAGLPEHAERYLERGAQGTTGRERRIIRAKVALATGRPRRAEADLLGLAGADVDLLRGQARHMVQDFEAAVELFASAGNRNSAAQAAWEGGLWSDVSELEEGILADAALLVADVTPEERQITREEDRAPAPDPDNEIPVLERNRQILESSADLRALFSALNQETEITTALPE